jgi:ribosomal protein S12 methylthiotransferase accessory factor
MEIQITFSGSKQVIAHVGEHSIITDQPIHVGGDNIGPSPFSLFLASIGTCAGIYVKSFCDQRGIPTEGITITQKHSFNPSTQMIDSINLSINVPKSFPEKYYDALIKVADQCAVKKHLQNPPDIRVYTNIQ